MNSQPIMTDQAGNPRCQICPTASTDVHLSVLRSEDRDGFWVIADTKLLCGACRAATAAEGFDVEDRDAEVN